MRAAVYTRISRDYAGEGDGVRRQADAVRDLCANRGYEIVGIYEDNDISAAGRKVIFRPAYQKLFTDAHLGKFDVIVAYSNSRLTRRMRELEDLIELSKDTGVKFNTVVSGDDDLSTASGKRMARIKGSIATGEADETSERLIAHKAQRAADGKPQGGRYRVYGYTRQWETIDHEAKIVREVFKRRAAGESCTAIARDLNTRGLRTVEFICRTHSANPEGMSECGECKPGNKWTSANLTKLLSKPGYAGRRLYNGEIIGSTSYPAIVQESVFDAVASNLIADSKGTNTRKHLLSGFLVCSKCLTTMKGKVVNADTEKRKGSYVCGNRDECTGLSINLDWADGAVIEALFVKQQLLEAAGKDTEVKSNSVDHTAEIAKLDTSIAELRQAYTDGDISLPEMVSMQKTQKAKRTELLSQQATNIVNDMGPWVQPQLDWPEFNLSQKRVYLQRFISTVAVSAPKNAKGKNKRDDSRLEVTFTDGEVKRLKNMGPYKVIASSEWLSKTD